MKITRHHLLLGASVGARLFVGVIMIWAGFDKFRPYDMGGAEAADWAATGARFISFFRMMENTGGYWQFIGVTQIVTGVLLVTQRWALLGALMAFPFLCNVVVLHLAINAAPASARSITVLFALNVFLLLRDWPRLKPLLVSPSLAMAKKQAAQSVRDEAQP